MSQLGINDIYNIDCLDGLRQLGENSIDLIVTSPPYYNARDYSQWESVDDYMADMKEIFSMAYNCMKNHHYIIVNVGDVIGQVGKAKWSSRKLPLGAMFTMMLEDIGFELNREYCENSKLNL